MANSFNDVWIIDTPGATVLWKGAWLPKMIYWLNPINIGDTFVITDAGGNVLLEGKCEVANQSQIFNIDHWFRSANAGIIVPTLASGKLEIHFK